MIIEKRTKLEETAVEKKGHNKNLKTRKNCPMLAEDTDIS